MQDVSLWWGGAQTGNQEVTHHPTHHPTHSVKFAVYGLLLKNKMRWGIWLPHEWGDGYLLGGVLNSEKSFVHRAFGEFIVGCWPFPDNAIVCAVLTGTLGYGNLWFK